MNLYAYTGGDPIQNTDPSGLCFQGDSDDWDAVVQYAVRHMDGEVFLFPPCADWSKLTLFALQSRQSPIWRTAGGMHPGGGGGGGRGGDAEGSALIRAKEVATDVIRCALDHYGLADLALRTGSWVGAVPIDKAAHGLRVLPGASPSTNLISYVGHKYYPGLKSPMRLLGSNRVFGILGRANLIVGAGLVVYDVVSIGLCVAETQ